MNFKCKYCNNTTYYVVEGLHMGIYCAKCGKWHTWIKKDDYDKWAPLALAIKSKTTIKKPDSVIGSILKDDKAGLAIIRPAQQGCSIGLTGPKGCSEEDPKGLPRRLTADNTVAEILKELEWLSNRAVNLSAEMQEVADSFSYHSNLLEAIINDKDEDDTPPWEV